MIANLTMFYLSVTKFLSLLHLFLSNGWYEALVIISQDLLKTLHLFFVFAGVGGAITQMFILRRHRNGDANEAKASESMALVITRYIEFYGLILAFITGLALALLIGAFKGSGYLHAKTALVVVLIGLSHVDLRNIKKMIALRSEGKDGEASQVKQTHLTLGMFSLILAAAIVFLVVNQPF